MLRVDWIFLNKMNIALKEADETQYWLELLHESGLIKEKEFDSIYGDSQHVVGTLTKIVKTTKESI